MSIVLGRGTGDTSAEDACSKTESALMTVEVDAESAPDLLRNCETTSEVVKSEIGTSRGVVVFLV